MSESTKKKQNLVRLSLAAKTKLDKLSEGTGVSRAKLVDRALALLEDQLAKVPALLANA